jgi:hypothetical protein
MASLLLLSAQTTMRMRMLLLPAKTHLPPLSALVYASAKTIFKSRDALQNGE